MSGRDLSSKKEPPALSSMSYNEFDPFYHDPSTRRTLIEKKRSRESSAFHGNPASYFLYVRRPVSETALELPKEQRIVWESSAREMASAATLLPISLSKRGDICDHEWEAEPSSEQSSEDDARTRSKGEMTTIEEKFQNGPFYASQLFGGNKELESVVDLDPNIFEKSSRSESSIRTSSSNVTVSTAAFADFYPQHPQEIVRTKFLGESCEDVSWFFNGHFSKKNFTVRFMVREIDLVGFHQLRQNAARDLVKDLYIMNFFEHENLLHSLFILSEPKIFRMNIGLPRALPLSMMAKDFKLIKTSLNCSSLPYVSACLCRAVQFLHSQNIAHNYITIGHLVVDENGNIKLGVFSKSVIVRDDVQGLAAKRQDVWLIGIAILDYLYGAQQDFRGLYPNPAHIFSFENVFGVEFIFPSLTETRMHNQLYSNLASEKRIVQETANHFTLDEEEQKNQSVLKFIEACCQKADKIPTIDQLFIEKEFIQFDDDKFDRYRNTFIQKMKCYKFEIKPFYTYQPVKNKLPFVRTWQFGGPSNYQEKYFDGHLPAFLYDTMPYNDHFKLKTDSKISIVFIIRCDFYDPPPRQIRELIVGNEFSMFNMLHGLLDARSGYIRHENSACREWHIVNMPGQLYFPWDVFRLRRAIVAMLSETSTFDYDAATRTITKSRNFILCNHKSKLSREIEIQMTASHDDLINPDDVRIEPKIPNAFLSM